MDRPGLVVISTQKTPPADNQSWHLLEKLHNSTQYRKVKNDISSLKQTISPTQGIRQRLTFSNPAKIHPRKPPVANGNIAIIDPLWNDIQTKEYDSRQ